MNNDYRNPEDTTRMHNSPEHGPITLLKEWWKRIRGEENQEDVSN